MAASRSIIRKDFERKFSPNGNTPHNFSLEARFENMRSEAARSPSLDWRIKGNMMNRSYFYWFVDKQNKAKASRTCNGYKRAREGEGGGERDGGGSGAPRHGVG